MLLGWLALIAAPCLAADDPVPKDYAVTIGAYVTGLHGIDLKSGSVEVDMYLWLRSPRDKNLLESIEIANGSIEEKSAVVTKRLGDLHYASMRVKARVYQQYDLRRFPLDTQNIQISFEDGEDDVSTLRFVPDTSNTKVSSSTVVPGWKIGAASIAVSEKVYDTNYGDDSMGSDSSRFSRATVTIPIGRDGVGYFFKLFGTVFLSAAVAFLSFHIRPDDLDPRFGLGVGGIFAVVASNFVLASMLPETHQVTMGEALLLLTIVSIFLAILESVVSLKYWEGGDTARALKIDRYAGRVMPIVYVVASLAVVFSYLQR